MEKKEEMNLIRMKYWMISSCNSAVFLLTPSFLGYSLNYLNCTKIDGALYLDLDLVSASR